jgi:hypothetical protein
MPLNLVMIRYLILREDCGLESLVRSWAPIADWPMN